MTLPLRPWGTARKNLREIQFRQMLLIVFGKGLGLVGLGFIKKRIKIKANVYSRVPSKVLTYCPFTQTINRAS